MEVVNPLASAFDFFLAFYSCLPTTFRAFIGLFFFVFLLFSIFSLIYKIRS